MARRKDGSLDVAAARFLKALVPSVNLLHPSSAEREIYALVLGGFRLYQHDWHSGPRIVDWVWPFDELERGGPFEGNEPWTVLLREAVALSKETR